MFLVGEHQHGVSIQISISLGKTFLRISRIRNIPLTWILARVFVYVPPFISQILDFIYWMVLIFILIYFEWRDTENQQFIIFVPTEIVYWINCYCDKDISHVLTFSLIFLARILCFCNSPSCPQAVCESTQRCFTKLRKEAKDDGNVSSSILYGCSEELNSSGVCTESSFMLCCDRQLCNMPNMLRSKFLWERWSFFFQSVTQVARVLQTEVGPMTFR